MAFNFNELIRSIEQMGFYEVVLPFMLVFTIIFALLQKVKLFGTGNQTRNFNVVIAFVTAFFLLRTGWIVHSLNLFLPRVSFVVIIILMFLLMLGIFGTSSEGFTGLPFFIALVVSVIGIAWAILGAVPGFSSASWIPAWLRLDDESLGMLLAGGIVVLIMWFITKGDRDQNEPSLWKKAYGELSDPSKWGRGGNR